MISAPHLNRIASLLLSIGLVAASNSAVAQQPQPPAPPATAGQAPQPPHPPGGPMTSISREYHGGGEMHPGARIVPPGTWWRNPDMITALTLTDAQQKKMDDILLQSRIDLVHLKASLDEQQLLLEPMLNANPPDSAKSLAQISKIADLRASLEKANAKMLLSIRAVLTADQWTKLQATGGGRHTFHRDAGSGSGQGQGAGRGDGQGRMGGGAGGHEYRTSPPDIQ